MLLSVNQDQSHSIISVDGEVDLSTSDQLDAAIIQSLTAGTSHLTVDLSKVAFLDSSGLGVIVKGLKRAKDSDVEFDVVIENERVLKVFKLTGLDSVINIFPTLSAATGV